MPNTPEDAVRAYLRWREDPDSVRPDTAEIDARIDAATDPIERVKLRSERARQADVGAQLEAGFVTHVADWARTHEVTPEALLEEGVERRLLAEAGLLQGAPRSPGRAPNAPGKPGSTRRTSRDEIERHLRGLRSGTTVTTATVMNDVGGSVGTVRRVLDAMVAEGVIAEAGKDHSGPGRPRTLYERR